MLSALDGDIVKLIDLILFLSLSIVAIKGRTAVGDPSLYWPNGSTLNVRFLDGEAEYHEFVKNTAREWSLHGNIQFRFFTEPKEGRIDHIRITFYGSSNASEVGTESVTEKAQHEHSMKLPVFTRSNKSFQRKRRVVLHEFGHALGWKHEHQSPAFPYVRSATVIERCVEVKLQHNAAQEEGEALETCSMRYEPLDPQKFQFTNFDPESVMMYSIRKGTLRDFPNRSYGKPYELSSMATGFVGQVYRLINWRSLQDGLPTVVFLSEA